MKHLPFLGFFLILATIPLVASASEEVSVLNVRSFGAKGDGKADDTAAIQAAFDAIKKHRVTLPRDAGGRTAYSSPHVYFPAGRYRVSETLVLDGIANLKGDPYAILEQANPAKNLVQSVNAWIMNVEGLTFCGGWTQLYLYNGNLNGGTINVSKCNFIGASDFALVADIESTTLSVEKTNFFHCMQGLRISRCDVAVVRDGWFVNHRDMKSKAFVESRGQRVLFENVCGVPAVNGFDQRWIDNYGTNLTLKHIRFGGEGGGFTPVVNFSPPKAIGVATSVVMEDCWAMNTSNIKRDAAVYLKEIPNVLSLRNNTLTSRHLILLDEEIDPGTYFTQRGVPRYQLSYDAQGNVGAFERPELPEALKSPRADEEIAIPQVSPEKAGEIRRQVENDWRASGPERRKALSSERGVRYVPESGRKERSFADRWTTEEIMDGTRIPSSQYLDLAWMDGSLLFFWKREGKHWPHITMREVEVDLDRTPILAFQWYPGSTPTPRGGEVKVLAPDHALSVALTRKGQNKIGYDEYNLKELLGLSGPQKISLRFYPRSHEWIAGKGYDTSAKPRRMAGAGDYGVIDFVRFQSQSSTQP